MNEVIEAQKPSSLDGFKFVEDLAADLNTGDVKLPSFPDVVMRIKRAIEQQDCNSDKLSRIVSSEPALAARLLKVANSALMQRGGKTVGDLKTAISRLGMEMLHNTAVSVAVEQIFLGASLKEHRERLRDVWRDAAHVAAVAYIIARRTRCGINPDQALLAGLLHNVGKLYIIMNASSHGELFANEEALESVTENWHSPIGKAILESWGFSEDKVNAVADHMDMDRQVNGPADMTDVVGAAWMMTCRADDSSNDLDAALCCTRLGLTLDKRNEVLRESADEIQALAQALRS